MPTSLQAACWTYRAQNIFYQLPTAPFPSEAFPTPVKVKNLAAYLSGYPETFYYLLCGLLNGFRLQYYGPIGSSFSNNLFSASEHPDRVDQKLIRQIQAGRVVGPFTEPPLPNLRISPLGVISKIAQGEFRMIHHLSFPFGAWLITLSHKSFVQNTMLRSMTQLRLSNVQAYRIILIHPSDYYLLGMQWEGNFYVDGSLPMGCASYCKILEALSTAMEWVARNKLVIPNILHILDDSLILKKSHEAGNVTLQRFLHFCEDIGAPMAPDKTEGPSHVLTFAGIELDCLELETRLLKERFGKNLKVTSLSSTQKKNTTKGATIAYRSPAFCLFGYNLGSSHY